MSDVVVHASVESVLRKFEAIEQAIKPDVENLKKEQKTLQDAVEVLVGDDKNKSVRAIALEEVGRVVDGAPEAFDTLNEISKYIEEDETGAAAMAKAIADNRDSIDNEIARSTQADNALAARTKTLENISAETVKKLAAKADTTAVAEALGTKADKKDIPDLSGYATKKYVDDEVAKIPEVSSLIPKYKLVTATIVDGKVTVEPYSITEVTVDDSVSSLTFVFPEKTKGQSRDFFVRLVVTGETPPTLSFVEPNGDAVSFDVDDDSWAEIEQGVNIFMFTDTDE